MRKALLAALALALAAAVTPAAFALPGTVGVDASATDVTCNGTSAATVTLQSVEPAPEDAPLDVVIAIDESGSLNATDFNREKQAAIAFVNGLDFAANNVRRVAVYTFSTDARRILSLSPNKTTVINAINSIVQRSGSTNITDAIRDARAEIQTFGQGPAADRVLLLFTDGEANVETGSLLAEANAFKSTIGGEIFALGFGAADTAQLTSIASLPTATHVYIAPSPAQLESIAASIADTIQNPAATNVVLNVTATGPFAAVPGSGSATTGAVAPVAGGFRWTIPSVGTATHTLTLDLLHTGDVEGAFAALNIGGTYRDSDGTVQSITVASPTVTVTGCNEAPVADAGADQAVALSGSTTAAVGMNGAASSDPDGDTLSYEWFEGATSLGTGATPTVPFGLGTHTVTLLVTDPAGLTDTDEVVITVTDPTPPAITPTVTGTLGDNGWYTSNVDVSWTVVDLESAATATGCEPSSVSADTAGVAFTCSATSAGGASSETVSLKRDATAPVIAFAGHAGSYDVTDTVAITCSASDALSGLASSTCPGASGPATSFLGSNTLSATATDAAGNTASASTTFTVEVDVESLCELTERFAGHAGVSHSLCVKLERGSIGAYVNEVNAQRGKRLTAAEADLLISLAREL